MENNQLEKRQGTSLDVNRFEPRNFSDLMQYCAMVVESGLCPKDINRPADAMLIIQRGAELGLPTIAALQNLYVIDSKGSKRIGMYADAAIALVRRNPVCIDFQVVDSTDDVAICQTWRKGARGREGENYATGKPFTYSIADARTANLSGKDTYKAHPRAMLLARCKMALARMVYEDILAGVYAREEFVEDAGTAEVLNATFDDDPTEELPGDRDTTGGIDFSKRNWHEQVPRIERWDDHLKWDASTASFNAIAVNAGVKNGNLETFKRMLIERHEVPSWEHMPPRLIDKWIDYLNSRGDELRDWMLQKIDEQNSKEQPNVEAEAPQADFDDSTPESEPDFETEGEETGVMDAEFEPVDAPPLEDWSNNEEWKHLIRSLKGLLRFCQDVDESEQDQFFQAIAGSAAVPRIESVEPVLLKPWVEQVKQTEGNDGSRDSFVRVAIEEWT